MTEVLAPTTIDLSTTTTSIAQSQLRALDDTDCYATAWQDAVSKAKQRQGNSGSSFHVQWGGRGQGGRGLARKTFQPKDVVVENVRLEYVGSDTASSRILLEGATLKLLSSSSDAENGSGKVYALVGHNGCGKSSLLRRIHAKKVPGFPPHLDVLYIPQDHLLNLSSHFDSELDDDMQGDAATNFLTPSTYLSMEYKKHTKTSHESTSLEIHQLEDELDSLDIEKENDQKRMEEIGEQILQLEESLHADTVSEVTQGAKDCLKFMGIHETFFDAPLSSLSPGERKKVSLAVALMCSADLLLLDEPTNHLDVPGLLQLRQLLDIVSKSRGTTVLMVSHDSDFLNDMATDIIHISGQKLTYYPGNYDNFCYYCQQVQLHHLRQAVTLEKKKSNMIQTLDNIKQKGAPKRGGARKGKQIECQRKKLERLQTEEEKLKGESTVDTLTRRGLSTQQVLKQSHKRTSLQATLPPDKAVQFVFRPVSSQWHKPLITAVDVGKVRWNQHPADPHYDTESSSRPLSFSLTKKGFLFDFIDFSVEEGGRYCIFGSNGCGKSVLLKIFAKMEKPDEGSVKHTHKMDVGYLDEEVVEGTLHEARKLQTDNALSYLSARYPTKSERDIRSELTAFGLSPKQATTDLRFLSGGELRRLCLANLMLSNPHVLILDQPTSNLDMESVDALTYGLSKWNGTLIMVSHDANFVRSIDAKCYALLDGKLQWVVNGIDAYLRSFA